jgi:hypothetical protein
MEIIKEGCQSTDKTDKMKYEKEKAESNISDEALTKKISSQQVISQQSVENFYKTNARCKDNLRKVTEVKSERKHVNFRDREDRIKFQAIDKRRF